MKELEMRQIADLKNRTLLNLATNDDSAQDKRRGHCSLQ
jgi:hypothetical protein